jgi:NAD(P)-dependent dehydrogenase (short-subunit alcohol dehydrogenase family)
MNKQVILVTGTSSGFGWLTAKTLSNAAHKVFATMRDIQGRNADKARELGAIPNVEVIELDVTKTASIQDAIDHIYQKEGHLDVLVNNAGVYAVGVTETFTEKDMQHVMDVDVIGPWRLTREVLPGMRKRNAGLIINISSVAGRFAFPFQTMYNTAKFAIEGLTEGLHYELRQVGVDAVLVQPGAFPTEVWSKVMAGSDQSIVASYGDVARIPDQIGAGVIQMFNAMKPDPQLVADAVLSLVEMPGGTRPLRTVVDPVTSGFTENANAAVKEQFNQFVTAFGLGVLL